VELLNAIAKRRSIQTYASTPVPREALLGLVDAARKAPSAANQNAWRFVLVTDRETLDRLSQTHRFCGWLASAQAAIAVVIDPAATRYWLEDSCVAASFIWLAATDAGLGAAWGAMHQSGDPVESQRRQDCVREVLGIPAGLNVPVVLGIGFPSGEPRPRIVPELAQLVSWERYAAALGG